MKRFFRFVRGLALLLCLHAPGSFAADGCDAEAQSTKSDSQRQFVVLAGRSEVFYEHSGPTFVMLIRESADEAEIGALGIYADSHAQPVFGAVPASQYEYFLREPRKSTDVMLRVELDAAQYLRALQVLKRWERRVQERALLYPDIALDNILLVKQVTAELNRCRQVLVPYELDWGLEDGISEHNLALRIPFEYFSELKRLNPGAHVPDSAMPAALVAASHATRPAAHRD
jgi:hypothetical protein